MEEESSVFNCDDYDFELFGDPRDGKATKKEKMDLREFIGGFEKWPELDDDCKMRVVGFLDYPTRCKLSLCSKKDHEIVKETVLFMTNGKLPQNDGIRLRPRNLAAMCRSDFEQKSTERGIVNEIILQDKFIEIHTSSTFVRSWKLSKRRNDFIIVGRSSIESQCAYSNSYAVSEDSGEREFNKIVQKVLKNNKNTVEKLFVSLTKPINDMPIKFENLKELEISKNISVDLVQICVNSLDCKTVLEVFKLGGRYWYYTESVTFPFEALDHPAIMNAKQLKVTIWMNITDEQFLSLNSPTINICTKTLSAEAIFEFIRRWVDGELSYDFKQCLIYTSKVYKQFENITEIFDGVRYENYTSFRNPNYRHFFSKFCQLPYGKLYQINKRNDPFTSISVFVSYELILILRTGFPTLEFGVPSTKLIYPDFVL